MNGRPWTDAEIRQLARIYPDARAEDVARALGRSVSAVYGVARKIGLGKSQAFYDSDMSARIMRGHQSQDMVASRFKPGNRPWNHGLKGSTGHHPNSRATQFKKGEMSGAAQHNYVPIGTLRISADGYLERKMTDDPSLYPARRWVPVHRLVWEAAHGPIPRGHIVVYRPGMKTTIEANVTVDRLECISKAENIRRNHPRSKSPELAKLVQIKGAITRQVNRIAREHEERNAHHGQK